MTLFELISDVIIILQELGESDNLTLNIQQQNKNLSRYSQALRNAVFSTRVIRLTVQRDLFIFISPPLAFTEIES